MIALSAGAAATAGLARPPRKPVWQCVGQVADDKSRILVIGDSWATYGALVQGLTDAASARVCAVGYSGATTWQIAARLSDAVAFLNHVETALGGRPDTVLLVAGVNDLVLHEGSESYARGLSALARQLAPLARQIATMELPPVDPLAPPTRLLNRVRAGINLYILDHGGSDPRADYIAAYCRIAFHPVVDLPDWLQSFSRATHGDSFHLTDRAYEQLGRHLAEHLSAQPPTGANGCGSHVGNGRSRQALALPGHGRASAGLPARALECR